eukprot:scaffold4454_cov82-Skeletonema_dohrnii-CCMP3373.AAC.2
MRAPSTLKSKKCGSNPPLIESGVMTLIRYNSHYSHSIHTQFTLIHTHSHSTHASVTYCIHVANWSYRQGLMTSCYSHDICNGRRSLAMG